jgi:hypothetical protein
MTEQEFEKLFNEYHAEQAEKFPHLAAWRPATKEEIAKAEHAKGVQLPNEFKIFLAKYGYGEFYFASIFCPLLSNPEGIHYEIWDYYPRKFNDDFLPISSNGDELWTGFRVKDGICSERLYNFNVDKDQFEKTEHESIWDFLAEVALVRHMPFKLREEPECSSQAELLEMLEDDPDLCDVGYEFADVDRKGYCLWVIDCARHLFPIAEQYLSKPDMTRVVDALDVAERFLDDESLASSVVATFAIVQHIEKTYVDTHGHIPHALAEALETIELAVKIMLPDSKVYHEDVISSSARAALAGELHENDTSVDGDDEEESDKERQWQINALKGRLLGGES